MKGTFYILLTPYPYPWLYGKKIYIKNKLEKPFTYLITSNFFSVQFPCHKTETNSHVPWKIERKVEKIKNSEAPGLNFFFSFAVIKNSQVSSSFSPLCCVRYVKVSLSHFFIYLISLATLREQIFYSMMMVSMRKKFLYWRGWIDT